jgi:predicted nuclease with TOPRIM domain
MPIKDEADKNRYMREYMRKRRAAVRARLRLWRRTRPLRRRTFSRGPRRELVAKLQAENAALRQELAQAKERISEMEARIRELEPPSGDHPPSVSNSRRSVRMRKTRSAR